MLTQREAAEVLGVSAGTLANWRYRRIGPAYVKTGQRVVRYRRTDLEKWLDARTVAGDAA